MPLIVDASVWIDHLRRPKLVLAQALRDRSVRMHRFVLAEIALGSLKDRAATITGLRKLRLAVEARHEEVMALVERERLYGRGIGYVDAHLLASTLITPATRLCTRDKRLMDAARELGVAAHMAN